MEVEEPIAPMVSMFPATQQPDLEETKREDSELGCGEVAAALNESQTEQLQTMSDEIQVIEEEHKLDAAYLIQEESTGNDGTLPSA